MTLSGRVPHRTDATCFETMNRSPTYYRLVLAAIVALFTAAVFAQPATQPTSVPVLAWDQPSANIPALVAMGVTTFTGPEVPNGRNLAPDALAAQQLAWIKATQAAGASCILRKPTG